MGQMSIPVEQKYTLSLNESTWLLSNEEVTGPLTLCVKKSQKMKVFNSIPCTFALQ